MRRVAKRIVERALRIAVGRPSRMAGRSLILAYHNVVADDSPPAGDRSLHLPLSSFVEQLEILQRHAEVRPVAEILAGGLGPGGPFVAVTFDDAYRGAVELALPELARRGLPSTVFVAPGLLGASSFWWDRMAGADGLPDALRDEALGALAGHHERIGSSLAAASATNALPAHHSCATEEQVRALSRQGPVTIGAHTWNHPNLSRLEGAELAAELNRPLQWLRTLGDAGVPVLAYPYGLHSEAVRTATAAAGYAAGLLVTGGWLPAVGVDPMAVPRLNVPAGLSANAFVLRLAGWLAR